MKTQLKVICKVTLLVFSFLILGCSEEAIDEQLVDQNVSVDAELQNKAIPTLRLNHPKRGTSVTLRNDTYFNRSGSTFKFYLPKGTRNDRPRTQARIEAFTHNERKGNRTFSAKFNVGTTLPGQVTVAQLFAAGKGPNVRIEVRSDGSLRAGFGTGNAAVLSRNYNRKNFNIKITTNGKTASIYLNGSRKVTNRRLKHQNAANEWRWGLYYNNRNPRGIRSTVSNVAIR